MRPLFITALALLQACAVFSQHTEAHFQVAPTCDTDASGCEEYARQAGLPTDGWEIVYDNEGQPKCRRTAIHELCYGTEYFDADTKEKKCCRDVSGLTWFNKPAQLAKCCAKDHVWTYEKGGSSGRGGCCPVGYHMNNGVCTPLTHPPPHSCPTGTHLVDGHCVPSRPIPHERCPTGTHLVDGKCVPLDPHGWCPTGTHPIDGHCAPIHPPHEQCPTGTHSVDGHCVPLRPTPHERCPTGTSLVDGKCVPLDPHGWCPTGTHPVNGHCVPLHPPHEQCPTGTHSVDGHCVPLRPIPHERCPTGTHLIDGHCVPLNPHEWCPTGTHLVDGQCVPFHGPCHQGCGNGNGCVDPSCTCANPPVCGHGKYLGIKYGHCYILSFSDGEQLGIDRDHTDYKKNGFFVDIPFKVCNSTTDCSRGKEVEMGQVFSLQDQHGLYKDLLSTKGWINDATGGAHMEYTTDPKHAGKFTGIPTCAGGECALQLHGSPGGGALSYACPMPGPGLTLYGNPKVGQKLRFSEVSCDEYEVPLTSGINLK